MSNILGYYNNEKIKVKETKDENLNMPIVFVKNANTRNQDLLIDGVPNELYYNPSSKTLFVDNIETKIANLSEGEAIQIDNSVDNKTTVNVNFTKNTDIITTLTDSDTILISNTSNQLKTIRADKMKEDIRLTAGTNLSYGTGVNSNRLDLDGSISNTTLSTNCSWGGDLILATKLSDGSVSDTEFQKLNGLTSAILQSNQKNQNNGVCGLDSNGIIETAQLPSSINDIIEVTTFLALPTTGASNKIYVTLDNHKAYRWSGTAYIEISASLVIGTTNGTAYDGASGQANATAITTKQPILTASTTSGIFMDASDNIEIDMTKSNAETVFADGELMLIQKSNGNVCRLTKQQLKASIDTNTEYSFASPNLVTAANGVDISLNTSLTDMSKISSSSGNFTIGSEHEMFFISDENGSNGGSHFIWKTVRTSGGSLIQLMRLDGQNGNLGIGISPNSSYKLYVNGDVNIPSGSNYKIGGTNITDTTYNNGDNITIDGSNNINLDTTLEDVNSIESETNTDLKLQSTGTGDIKLKANPNLTGIGKIHLSRIDSDSIRFNTIEYSNNGNSAYIKFLVHYEGGDNTLTREVLKLNSNLSSEFSGPVTVNSIESETDNDLNLQSSGTGDILLRAIPSSSGSSVGKIKLMRSDAARFQTIEYKNTSSVNSYIKFLVHNGSPPADQVEVLRLKGDASSTFSGPIEVNSIKSKTNIDLNLQSSGTGDILLRAIPSSVSNVGKIKLMRSDAARFQTIEYKCEGSTNSYIKFLVHNGTPSADQVEVLRLKGDGNAEFSGTVNIKHSQNENGLKFETSGTTTETTSTISFNENQNELYGFMLKYEASSNMFQMIRKHNSATGVVVMSIGRESNNTTFSGTVTATSFVGPLTGNASTSSKIDSITNSDIVQLTSTQTLTNKTLESPNILTNCNISTTSGYASLEIGGPSGGFIDLKKPFSDDYDLRIMQDDTSKIISKSSLVIYSNDTTALTIDTSQNCNFAGKIGIGGNASANYKLNVDGAGHFGDALDETAYGQIQITRAATQPVVLGNIGHYISMIRKGSKVSGLGYKQSSNIMYIKNETYENTTSNGIYIDDNKIGINKESPAQALDVTGNIYASSNIDCTGMTGGRNNLADNFHIDNYSNAGNMYINYAHQRNIFFGKDYFTLFDLGNGTIKNVVQRDSTTSSSRRIMIDFFRKSTATSGEVQVGRIECDSTGTYYQSGQCDIRLKENIKPIENHFYILDKLKPCNFKFKSCEDVRDGFIADDLYEAYPICTSGKPGELNEDGSDKYMMIDTKPLIPILTKCIKGNREEIAELKNKVNELELKLNLIMEKLNI